MRKIIFTLMAVFFLFGTIANAQTREDALKKKEEKKCAPGCTEECCKPKKVKVELHGFVKYEAFYDSKEMADTRDGELFLYPKRPVFKNGGDINDEPTLNMLAIQTRLNAKITGPEAFGGKTSAYIEGDFLGRHQDHISHFRLRHAFMKINWTNLELLMGQTWHPMFVPECFPGVLSFGAAAPYNPLNRAPQIRATFKLGKMLQISGTLLSQRDFANATPTNPQISAAEMMRKSATPDAQVQVKVGDPKTFLLGATIGYKTLQPRDTTKGGYKTTKTIGGFNSEAFLTINSKRLKFKTLIAHGENMSNFVMIGGFGKKATSTAIDDFDYTPIVTTSMWADVETNTNKIIAGLFAGYTKINGSVHNIDQNANYMYARGSDIDYAYRVSPRVIFRSGKIDLGLEASYDNVAYTDERTPDFEAKNSKYVDSWRVLFMAKYSF